MSYEDQLIREATGQSPDFMETEPEETNESSETGDQQGETLKATNLHGDKWTGETQDGIYVYMDQQGNLYESKERPVYRIVMDKAQFTVEGIAPLHT